MPTRRSGATPAASTPAVLGNGNPSPQRDDGRWATVLCGGLIVAAVAATFAGVRHNEFLEYWDDSMIFDNPHLRALTWNNVWWAFTDLSAHPRHVYMPCSWVWWMLVNRVANLSPAVYHGINLAMHAINSVFVFLLVKKISCRLSPPESARDRAWQTVISGVATLAWALHPLMVEPVAWAITQKFLIATFLALLCLFLFLRWVEERNDAMPALGCYGLSLASFAVSLLFYPIALAVPAVLLVIGFCWNRPLSPSPRKWLRPVGAVIPFCVVSLACASIPVFLAPPPPLTNVAALPPGSVAFLSQTMTAAYLWVYYVWRPWIPVNLSAIYTTLIHVEPWSAPFVVSLVGLLALTCFAWALRKRQPWVLALWICHLALLTPVLGFGSPFENYPSDRYAYLQGICWAVLLAVVLERLLRTRTERVRAALLLPCGGALIALSLASQRQATMWHDSASFYGTLLSQPGLERYRPDLHWRLAQHYLDHKDLSAAKSALESGLQLNPQDPLLLYMLAGIHDATGNYALAEQLVRQSLVRNPVPAAWRLLGTICLHAGRLSAAEDALNSALGMDSRNGETHYLFAVLRYQQGSTNEALSELDRISAADPTYPDARKLRAEILRPSGDNGPISTP